MPSYTKNLELLKKDPVEDGSDTFNIETMLNENWDKIDRQVLRAMAAAAAYDAGKTYQQGDFCTQGGLLYRANQAIAQPEAWTAGHWTAISIMDMIRGLTAADVGAAPDGYGLGKGAKTVSDLDSLVGTGWCVGVPIMDDYSFGYCLVQNIQWTDEAAQQTAYVTDYTTSYGGYNTRIFRFKFKNEWGPWEWENPPMRLGVEYRTTERWNEKPVYVRYVNFGSAPNATTKSVSHGIENFDQCAGWTGILGGANLQGHSGITAVDINATSIAITTDKDLSASAVYVAIKYTKSTD